MAEYKAPSQLVSWIQGHCTDWRDNRDSNYLDYWKEYERLWRGEWAAQDRLRESERSRIVSPALQEAIENHASEIEEGVFGSGNSLFSMDEDMQDRDGRDVQYLQKYMKECFKKNGLRKSVGDIILLASIYGTGIGEIVIEKMEERVPATQPMPEVDSVAIGTVKKDKINVKLNPISPQNFLIDPNATHVNDAMGVAIEAFVSAHKVAEKGCNMQKALDAQLRCHLDSLALTTAPMMGMDATRLPRGAKFEIRPGKTLLTNGSPNEILMPFKFGVTDASNLQTAQEFQRMILQATNTLDTASDTKQPTGGELSITLATILKKNKRTLVNFQDNFLIPFIEKAAHRFMQFDPENFPVADYKFVANSSLGMLAKEVEQLQFINLLKTLGPNSPAVPLLLQGILDNSSLPNKETLKQMLIMSQQKEQQMKQQQTQLALAQAQAQIALYNSEAQENTAQAQNHMMDAQTKPQEVQAKLMTALATNLPSEADEQAAEFKRRVQTAELMLKEQELELKKQDMIDNKDIVKMQMANK